MHPTLAALKAAVISQPFKRAQLGLFEGQTKQYGNNVPFSKHKTRRSWLPNVQSKRLYSDVLKKFVRLKVTTRALRTIKKYGGIDRYLLDAKDPVELSEEGMRLRILIQDAKWHPKIAAHLPVHTQREVLAARQQQRLLDHPPTLEDAARVRKKAMASLGMVIPNREIEDPYFCYTQNTSLIVTHVLKSTEERRRLVSEWRPAWGKN